MHKKYITFFSHFFLYCFFPRFLFSPVGAFPIFGSPVVLPPFALPPLFGAESPRAKPFAKKLMDLGTLCPSSKKIIQKKKNCDFSFFFLRFYIQALFLKTITEIKQKNIDIMFFFVFFHFLKIFFFEYCIFFLYMHFLFCFIYFFV